MLQRIQMLNRGQRVVIFVLIFGGGIGLIVALTLILLTFTINTQPRSLAQSLVEGVTVREFAQLPDDDAYPANLAVNADGLIYTGSYESGVIYEILPDATVREVPQTREILGSVTGLTIAEDGFLYVFDRLIDNPRSAGGVIWRFLPGDAPREWGVLAEDEIGFVSPEDIIVLPDGTVYVADRGRREVLRFSGDGTGAVFWGAQSEGADDELRPTGLAYDAATDALIVTDSGLNRLFRVPLDGSTATVLYTHPTNDTTPDFTGVTLGTNGTIYVAALGGGVLAITPSAEEPFVTLAINFRGARDLVYYDGSVYVTNFDSASLVNPLVNPQLPFAIDVIEFQ